MDWFSNEMLFYGGLIVAVCSLVAIIVYWRISERKIICLNAQMDKEYGEKKNFKEY